MGGETTVAPATGPRVGELIPDFAGPGAAGRTIHRREYKGRRHLLLCFVEALPAEVRRALTTSLAARHAAFRADGAEIVVFQGAVGPADATLPYPVLADPEGRIRARYGAAEEALAFVADRYGEVVVRRTLAEPEAALDEAQAAVGWLQMRCSL